MQRRSNPDWQCMHLRIVMGCGAVARRLSLLSLLRHRHHQGIVDREM